MRFLVFFGILLSSVICNASKADCMAAVNMQFIDVDAGASVYGTSTAYIPMGLDPDGAPFLMSARGETVILNETKIVKRTLIEGVETITYKTLAPMSGDQSNSNTEIQRTVRIRREKNGDIVSVSKDLDANWQIKENDRLKKSSLAPRPLVEKVETRLSYKEGECFVEQTVGFERADENSKDTEQKVYYDHYFCERIKPALSKMDQQRVGECTSVLAQAQAAYEKVNGELRGGGKSFKESGLGKKASAQEFNASYSAVTDAIQGCMTVSRVNKTNANRDGKVEHIAPRKDPSKRQGAK